MGKAEKPRWAWDLVSSSPEQTEGLLDPGWAQGAAGMVARTRGLGCGPRSRQSTGPALDSNRETDRISSGVCAGGHDPRLQLECPARRAGEFGVRGFSMIRNLHATAKNVLCPFGMESPGPLALDTVTHGRGPPLSEPRCPHLCPRGSPRPERRRC